MLAVLVLAGVGWIWVVADLGASVQVFLPAWVQARALAIYQVVLFGCFAGSAAGWGLVAQWFGLPAAFTAAGVLLLAATASLVRWGLSVANQVDRSAVSYWPEPTLAAESAGNGPVIVSVSYVIDPDREQPFRAAMVRLRNSRLRTGGTRWRLYRDASDSTRFVEVFTVPSWAEHRPHPVRPGACAATSTVM